MAIALLGALALGGSQAPGAAAAQGLEIHTWRADLLPAQLAGDEPKLADRTFPLDSLPDDARPLLRVPFVARPPRIDGRMDDWPLVRRHDVRGRSTVVRGTWSGLQDAVLEFALLWTEDGLVLGAQLVDDSLQVEPGRVHEERVESVLLAVGSTSPLVQRYWRGAERTVRVWVDGSVQAWTRLRNRRPVLFDARALGARAAASVRRAAAGPGGRVEFELFVPWDLLFPALPHDRAGLLVNVLVEDVDAAGDKLFAWSVRPENGKLVQAWAKLHFLGGPVAGTWLVSQATSHPEPGHPLEWSATPWGIDDPHTNVAIELGTRRASRPWQTAEATAPRTAVVVRAHDLPVRDSPWPRERRIELVLGPAGSTPWRRSVLHMTPTLESFEAVKAEVDDTRRAGRGSVPAFPLPEDLLARLERIASGVQDLGDWHEQRYSHRGILVSRAARWDALETDLAEAQLLRDLIVGGPDPAAARARAAALWPERSARGHPVAQPVLRGHRSRLDGSVQPYALYVSRAAASGSPAPLLVVLHDLAQNEMSLLEGTSLAAEVESRGWIAVCPYGRGDTGFQLAGERDVLEVLERVEAELAVDATRIYLTGFSMGGTGTWLLSLRHADLFAAASVVSAFGDMDQAGLFEILGYHPSELFFYETLNPARLVRTDLTTPYRIVHAERDPVISVVHARIMEDHLKELGTEPQLVLRQSDAHTVEFFDLELHESLDFLERHRRETEGVANMAWFGGTGGPLATVFARGPFAVVYGTRELPPS
ncbi:MAG: prolyl oligopeptidase family serine peptidase, partial [Candidatus Krumholzibacteriia bacterium]